MFQLDPRTVIFSNFIYTFSIFVFIAFIPKKYSFLGYRNWVISLLLISLNFLILSLRSIIPMHIVFIVPHLMVIWAYIEIKRGLCLFYKIKNRIFTDFIIIGFFIPLLFFNETDARFRIIILCIFSIFVFLDTAILFLSNKVVQIVKGRLIPKLYAIAIIVMLVRLKFGLEWDPKGNPLDTGNNLSIISILFFITNLVIFFSLFLIVLSKILTERDHLIHQLRDASLTDELTGMMNRRGFKDVTKYEFNRFSRTKKGFTFVLGDIDYFKIVNDNYGHDTGDFVLKIVAKILTEGIRDIDTSARWGGEEFVLLLPETDLEQAEIVLERIRTDIELKEFKFNKHIFHITMSFGATHTNDPKIAQDQVIKKADDNLYEAKKNGRNKIVASEIF